MVRQTRSAGGNGGLLAIVDGQGQASVLTYDAIGDVSELISVSGAMVSAHYEYDVFGDPVVTTGPSAGENEFRYSTKPSDPESGLYNYGYRDDNTGLGRWTRRDPLGEQGGLNLHAYVGNMPLNASDAFGLDAFYTTDTDPLYLDPKIVPDEGSGTAGAEAPTLQNFAVRQLLVGGILWAYYSQGWTDAATHLADYLEGHGTRAIVDFPRMLREVPSEYDVMLEEAVRAARFAENEIAKGTHKGMLASALWSSCWSSRRQSAY